MARGGYTRAAHQSVADSVTHQAYLESPVHPTCLFLDRVRTQREQTRGECADSTQRALGQSVRSNLGPSHYEATVLATAPLCWAHN